MFNAFLNNYFGFNKQQRNGLGVLMTACFLLLAVRVSYPKFIKPDTIHVANLSLYELKLDSAIANTKKAKYATELANQSGAFFVFNPNSVTLEQLLLLGFKEKTAKRFIKFRAKGFVFKNKPDLKKVYGISDNFYSKLEPYIVIDKIKKKVKEEKISGSELALVSNAKQVTSKIELNSADSLALIEVNGIGPSYAKRILKYRSILGGYVSVEQLKEVYGFTEETYEKVKSSFTADPKAIKKIDLNKDSFKSVNKHPYLSYEITKLIFDWRRKSIITATNLKEILNDETLYTKVLPYLYFE